MSDESAPQQAPYVWRERSPSFAEKCMRLAIGSPFWLWRHAPASVKSVEGIRKLGVDAVVIIAIVILGIALWYATAEKITIVEPIGVPKALEERGYTSTTIAQRLIDQAFQISRDAHTAKEPVQFARESQYAALSSLQVPEAGVTVQSIVSVLRKLVGQEDQKVGGEITIVQPAGSLSPPVYSLVLRFDLGNKHHVNTEVSADLDELIRKSSLAILQQWDPFALASYAYTQRRWAEVDAILDRLEVSSDEKTRKWALNLRGVRYFDRENYEMARDYYERATKLDERFAVALSNYGNALRALKKYEEAYELYEKAANIDKKLILPYLGWALGLAENKQWQAALDKAKEAVDRDSSSAVAHKFWGDLLAFQLDKPDYRTAFKKYEIAVALDPKYAAVLNNWALALRRNGDMEKALEKYQAASKVDASTPYPHVGIGLVLLARGDRDGALEKFREALKLDAEYAYAHRLIADELARRRDYGNAIWYYTQARTLSPQSYAGLKDEIQKYCTYRDRGSAP